MSKIIKNKQFTVYSKSAALQLKVAKFVDDIKEGIQEESYSCFIDAAKSLGTSDKAFDWKNKITIKLAIPDIAIFLKGFRFDFDKNKNINWKGEASDYGIYHDPGKGSATEGQVVKSMSIQKGAKSGYLVNFSQKKDGQTLSFMVPVPDDQMIIFKIMFEEAAKMITGFYAE